MYSSCRLCNRAAGDLLFDYLRRYESALANMLTKNIWVPTCIHFYNVPCEFVSSLWEAGNGRWGAETFDHRTPFTVSCVPRLQGDILNILLINICRGVCDWDKNIHRKEIFFYRESWVFTEMHVNKLLFLWTLLWTSRWTPVNYV